MVLRHIQTAQLAANLLAVVGIGSFAWKGKRREVIVHGASGIAFDRRDVSQLLRDPGGGISGIALFVVAHSLVDVAGIPEKSGKLRISRSNSLCPLLRGIIAVTRNSGPVALCFRNLNQS